jgi:four helix bundle protein
MEKKSYKDLVVWQRAIDLVPKVYELIRVFPKEETYALSDQVRRAAVSVPANIAEGQARNHRKEFLQHLSIAKGSLAELHTLLVVACKLGYIAPEGLAEMEDEIVQVSRPLHGLIRTLRPPTP